MNKMSAYLLPFSYLLCEPCLFCNTVVGMERLIRERRPFVPYHIPCPLACANIREMIDRTTLVTKMFEYLTPMGVKLLDVYPIRSTGKYKCAWRVRYFLDLTEEEDRNKLWQIRMSHPQNTSIILESPIRIPPIIDIDYSIIKCDCRPLEYRNVENFKIGPITL